jgi:glycosyltransferase involved in cell wall biosynthesis
MEKHVQRLSEEQRLLGCKVSILFNEGERTSDADRQVFPFLKLRRVRPQFLRDAIFFVGCALEIVKNRVRTDVIHVHGDWGAFAFTRWLRRLTGAKLLVASVHGTLRAGRWRRVYKYVLQNYGIVYCTGARDAAYLGTIGIGAKWQASGINDAFFSEASRPSGVRESDVVTVANLVPVKNIKLVLEIAKAMPDKKFLIIGDGPERATLENECRDNNSCQNVLFAGHLNPEEICVALNSSKALLATSLHEGTPTAFVEAMACGLPVVTSCSNDYRSLFDIGFNGFVIQSFAAEEYVAVLRSLLGNTALLRQIAVFNQQQVARAHAWPEVAKRITSWMQKSLAAATSTGNAERRVQEK